MAKCKYQIFAALSIIVLLLAACAPVGQPLAAPAAEMASAAATEQPADERLAVFASILPQKYFVERIGGDYVTAYVMVEPGASPATYEPKPAQMVGLANAAAYFSIGVPFENVWLEKIQTANSTMMMVDTTQGIERVATPDGGFDPHIWLSPTLVKIQAQAIYDALAALDPLHQDAFKANLAGFLTDIDTLDAQIRATLANTKTKKFIVFHPAWGYFARDYGLQQIPIEVGGQEPSAQELANLIQLAQDETIKVIFVQPEFDQEDAETIAIEIGGQVIAIGALAPDWLANLQAVADTFAAVLSQ